MERQQQVKKNAISESVKTESVDTESVNTEPVNTESVKTRSFPGQSTLQPAETSEAPLQALHRLTLADSSLTTSQLTSAGSRQYSLCAVYKFYSSIKYLQANSVPKRE